MSFEGKNLYGQYIDYSEKKKNGPRASSAPILGLFSISFVYTAAQVFRKKSLLNSKMVVFQVRVKPQH